MTTRSGPIVVEQTFLAPLRRVWQAITDKDQMPKWFFEGIHTFKPELGFETRFDVHAFDKVYTHHWKVTEVAPLRRLVYDWLYDGVPGASYVVWELAETANGTTLTLSHHGTETFPEDDQAFNRESCQGGWNYFIGERLQAFLAKLAV